MRYIEWLVLFVISGCGIALANFVGFDVGFMESLPGILVLLVIAALGVAVSKVIPLKLPVVAYVSIIGLLAACPAALSFLRTAARFPFYIRRRSGYKEVPSLRTFSDNARCPSRPFPW